MKFVEFTGPRGTLRGALHLPDGDGPVPGVVMLHGFGAQRMEWNCLFVAMARKLEAAGIAALRFDFHGSGESDGDFIEMTLSGERADALAALDWFKAQRGINGDRVGLMGMSMGGLLTALTLGSRSDVLAAALWAPAGRMIERWNDRLDDAQQRSLRERGWVDLEGRRLSRDFLDDLAKHKPYDEVIRYAGPVLVIHGTEDQTVPLSEGQGYVRALETRGGAVTEHLWVEGADHPWPQWKHRQLIFDRTVDWFRRHL